MVVVGWRAARARESTKNNGAVLLKFWIVPEVIGAIRSK